MGLLCAAGCPGILRGGGDGDGPTVMDQEVLPPGWEARPPKLDGLPRNAGRGPSREKLLPRLAPRAPNPRPSFLNAIVYTFLFRRRTFQAL